MQDYNAAFTNGVARITTGRNAGKWRAIVPKGRGSKTKTKVILPDREEGPIKTQRQAEQARADYIAKLDAGITAAKSNSTVEDRLLLWEQDRDLKLKLGEITQSTRNRDEETVKAIRVYFGTGTLMQAVDKDEAKRFFAALRTGSLSPKGYVQERGKMSGSASAKTLRVLRTIWDDALDVDIVIKNPWARIDTPSQKPERVLYLTPPEQVEALVEAALKRVPRWAGLIASYGFLGARRMEGVSLWWQDVNHDKGSVSLLEQLADDKVTRRDLKTKASARTLSLDPRLEPFLGREAKLASRSRTFAFITTEGTPLQWNIGRNLEKACQAAGLPRLTPHMLRHSFATALLYQGLPIPEVTRMLGHADSQVTMTTYAHCFTPNGDGLSYEWPEEVAA
jgi:integrase